MNFNFPSLESLLNGETLSLEYKQDLDARNKNGPLDTGTLAGSLMALGNAQGGCLLLGVDNKGRIHGAQRSRNRSVTKLLHMPADNAVYRLLPALVGREELTKQGEKRHAVYQRP